MSHSSYLRSCFDPKSRNIVIKNLVKQIKKLQKEVPVNAIICRGNSGTIISSIVAHTLELDLIVIRKEENSHGRDVEMGYYNNPNSSIIPNAIIIDDFISSGNTISKIIESISNKSINVLGIMLYQTYNNEEYFDYTEKIKFPLIYTCNYDSYDEDFRECKHDFTNVIYSYEEAQKVNKFLQKLK